MGDLLEEQCADRIQELRRLEAEAKLPRLSEKVVWYPSKQQVEYIDAMHNALPELLGEIEKIDNLRDFLRKETKLENEGAIEQFPIGHTIYYIVHLQQRVAELEAELAQSVIIGKKLPAILEYHDDSDR